MEPRKKNVENEDDYEYYRGMRLEFRANGDVFWRTPKDQSIYIQVKSGLEKVVKKLLKLRPSGGTFRITEAREVLLKQQEPRKGGDGKKYNQWFARYVCDFKDNLEFESTGGGIDNNPVGLKAGDFWTGIYDGTRLSFVRDTKGLKIWWTSSDGSLSSLRYAVKSPKMPTSMERELGYWKPLGGRFCVTPNGHVITLIDPKQQDGRHRDQFADMTDAQQQLIDIKEEKTQMFAIYIGKWDFDGVFEFQRPREYGEKITEKRRKGILSMLGDFSSKDNQVTSSMVPEDAEPLIPMINDIEVLEENERQFWEEE
jgi:hypothetical protein